MKNRRWQVWLLGLLLPLALGLGLRAHIIYRSFHQALSLQQQAQDHVRQKRRDQALECLAQAIAAYPYLLELYQDRADIYIVKRQWKEALACWDQALLYAEGSPSQGLCRRQRALLLAQLGRRAEACQDARLAVKLNPHDHSSEELLQALESQP